MRIATTCALVYLFTCSLYAQFDRVTVNNDNIASQGMMVPFSDTTFALSFNDQLYQLSTSNELAVSIQPVENSIIDIADLKTHDIDLDGDLDVICWQFNKGQFTVYLNENGNLVYSPQHNFSGGPHHLHSQDFDGDGVPDLMLNHNVYVTTGPFEWERVLRYPLTNEYVYRYTQFIDHDIDGDMDILFHQVHWLRVLINDGDGTTTQLLNINETQNRVSWCRVINTVNGPKTIYYDRVDDMVREVKFDTTGYTIMDVAPMDLNDQYSDAYQADIDGDGNEEVVAHAVNNRDIVVLKYDPDSGTGQVTYTDYASSRYNAMGLFKIGGEIKLFGGNASTFEVYGFDDEFNAVLESSSRIAIDAGIFEDLDGDGNTDIIAGNLLKRYEGEGGFDQIREVTYPATGGQLIDYDDDGDLDYVTDELWFENTGDLMFGPAQEITIVDPTPDPEIFFTRELLRADIDLDGDTDILTYNNFGEPLELLENIENDYFEDAVTLATSEDIGGDAVLARVVDMNNDGDMDILMVAESGAILLKNNGGLQFDSAVQLYSGDRIPLTAELGDVNGDAYPDFILGTRDIVAGSALGEVILYLGNASIPMASAITSGKGYHRAAFANIDKEGWLDIVYLNSDGLYWAKTSDGVQFDKTQIDVSFLSNGKFAIRDVNSDGDDDIIVYRDGNVAIYYYLNQDNIEGSDACPTGDIYLRSQRQVDEYPERFGACTELPGSLFVGPATPEWSDIHDLTPLRGIEKVGGNLTLYYNNALENLNGLEDLHTIEGSFVIDGYKTDDFSGIENLRRIGANINFRNVATVGSISTGFEEFEQLDSIGGGIIMNMSHVRSIAPLIQPVIRGDLIIRDCRLRDTTGFSTLDSIYGRLELVNTELVSLQSLANIDHVGGVDFSNNGFLLEFNCLHNISKIPGDVVITNNNYNSLPFNSGLDSLKVVGGDLDLTGPECKAFTELDSVGGQLRLITKGIGESSFNKLKSAGSLTILTYEGEDFRQFSALEQVSDRINITNNKVTSLFGLNKIRGPLTSLIISNNRSLLHLNDLHDSLTVDGEIQLWYNYNLTYCNSLPICNHLAMGRPLDLMQNGIGCIEVSDVRCPDNAVSGFVFYDRDKNGVKDATEAGLSNIALIFNNSQDTTITAGDGFFITNASAGDSVNVRAVIPDMWEAIVSDEIVIDSFIPGLSANNDLAFGLFPTFQERSFDLSYSNGIFLCDREFTLQVDIFNTGTETENCRLEIRYPMGVRLVDTFSAYTVHDEVNRILTFDLDTLYPFFSESVVIPFIAPNADFLDEDFEGDIRLLAVEGANVELLKSIPISLELLCAYDPNDKLVRNSSGGPDLELNSEEPLTYTVRFQNTGNYYAENVRIIDTISPLLDLSTFEFISASHPVEIHKNGRVLSFNFNMINLPDSTLDFAGSQGYVTFRIHPVSTMTSGIRIENEADIYFDFNPPILTNRVESVVLEPSSTKQPRSATLLTLFPNPATNRIYIDVDRTSQSANYRIWDPVGRIVGSGTYRSSGIDLSHLSSGMHTIRLYDGEAIIGVGKFLRI